MKTINVGLGLCMLPGLVLFFCSGARGADPTTAPLLHQSDFTYLGAFKLPTGTLGSTYGFNYAGSGGLGTYAVAFNAASNSLFIGGHPYEQRVAEIAIPGSLSGTPVATALTNLVDPVEGQLGSINPTDTNAKFLGAGLVYNQHLYLGGVSYYDGGLTQTKSYFSRPVNLGTAGQVVGPRQVGSVYPGWVDRSATTIPAEWQPLLGGPALGGGGGGAINAVQSWGPSALVFDPTNVDTQANVPAALLLGYPVDNPLNPTTTGNPFWAQTDVVAGQAFVAGTRSLLFFGYHGMGDYCYGAGTTDPALHNTMNCDGGLANCCYDLDNSSKGTHAYPYRSQVWAYDANDLLAVKNGTKQGYQVQPYAVWELDASFKEIQGVGYDPTAQRLYISQPFGDNDQPLIRVYHINTSAASYPPQNPRALRIR